MKFVKFAGSLHPADDAARSWLMTAEEEDELELVARQRTSKQNNSLHLWAERCATFLREAGYDLKAILRKDAEIPVTKPAFIEYVWRPVQKAMTGYESTTKPSPTEYPEIADTITRHMATRLGVTLPEWPCEDSMMREQTYGRD